MAQHSRSGARRTGAAKKTAAQKATKKTAAKKSTAKKSAGETAAKKSATKRAGKKTAARRAAPRKTAATRKTASADVPVTAAGEQIFVLDVPFRAPAPGARYYRGVKAHAYVGAALPAELAVYRGKPYSYARWLEEELTGAAGPGAEAVAKTPRSEQRAAAAAIVAAHAAGHRGFLLADDPGLGKTGSAVLAARQILDSLGGRRTALITVDRPAQITIPAWREALGAFGDGGHRWLIMSPDQLGKLIAGNGRARYHFDLVINDEAQQFRHVSARRTRYLRRINKLSAPPAKAPFVLTVTATPGHHPGEYTYLSALLAQVRGEDPTDWEDLGARLLAAGLPLQRAGGRWEWDEGAKTSRAAQTAAVTRVRRWLTDARPPAMLHRDAPWGPAPVEGLPVDFTPAQWALYEADWGQFRREMNLARRGRDIARGRAALMRLRQKSGMLRAEQTADLVAATVERGYQVLVAAELVTTAADPIAALLEQKGVTVARIYGGGRDTDLEAERLRFQRGAAQAVVFTTAAAINLQASELMADGTRATDTARIGYFHQPRYSGIAARQTIGRAHRDYQVCPWSLLYATGTVEQAAARTMIDRMLLTAASVDGDAAALAEIAALFDADWMPASGFTG